MAFVAAHTAWPSSRPRIISSRISVSWHLYDPQHLPLGTLWFLRWYHCWYHSFARLLRLTIAGGKFDAKNNPFPCHHGLSTLSGCLINIKGYFLFGSFLEWLLYWWYGLFYIESVSGRLLSLQSVTVFYKNCRLAFSSMVVVKASITTTTYFPPLPNSAQS